MAKMKVATVKNTEAASAETLIGARKKTTVKNIKTRKMYKLFIKKIVIENIISNIHQNYFLLIHLRGGI